MWVISHEINKSKQNFRTVFCKIFSPAAQYQYLTSIAMLLYQKAVTNKISRLLAKKTVHIPQKKNIHMLRPVKDDLGLKVPGMYRIPCECGKVYIGQTGKSIEARCKEHMMHVCLKQPDNSVVAEHNF
jgi:hypothetical protein